MSVKQEFAIHIQRHTNLINEIIQIIWQYISGEQLFSRIKTPCVVEAWEKTYYLDFLKFEGSELILQLERQWNGFFLETEVKTYSQIISELEFIVSGPNYKNSETGAVGKRCFYVLLFSIQGLGRVLGISEERSENEIGNGPNDSFHNFKKGFLNFVALQIALIKEFLQQSSKLNRPKMQALILILAWIESDEVLDLISSCFEWGGSTDFLNNYLSLPGMGQKIDKIIRFQFKRKTEKVHELVSLSNRYLSVCSPTVRAE